MKGIKIHNKIYWLNNQLLNPEDRLPDGHYGRMYGLSNEEYVIIVNNNINSNNDIITIAHEIAHIVLKSEGYPLVGLCNGIENEDLFRIAFSLNNMIHDPLVNKILIQYGFDLQSEDDKELIEVIKYLDREQKGNKWTCFSFFLFVI